MESSLGVLFRAAVMLSCLVALPLLAVLGKISLPPEVTKFFSQAAVGSLLAPGTRAEAAESSAGDQGADLPLRVTNGAAIGEGNRFAGEQPQGSSSTSLPGYDSRPGYGAAAEAMPAAGGNAPPADRMQAILGRMRTLGVRHHALETWGPAGDLYRFQARVMIDGNAELVRHVEAVAADPLAAMTDVLQQVETQPGR